MKKIALLSLCIIALFTQACKIAIVSPTLMPTITPKPSVMGAKYPDPKLPAVPSPEATQASMPKPKQGVWQRDTYYGINGWGTIFDVPEWLRGSRNLRFIDPSEVTPTSAEYQSAVASEVRIDDWTYYLDVSRPLRGNDGWIEFPLCRRNNSGHVQDLQIPGFAFTVSRDFLYIENHYDETEFCPIWVTFRVTFDGTQKAYMGSDLRLFVPEQGDHFYFTAMGRFLYRSDLAFERVERLLFVLPDQKDINAKKIGGYELYTIDKVEDGWIFFTAEQAGNGGSFVGHYKVKESGGLAIKTDKGIFAFDEDYDGEGEDE